MTYCIMAGKTVHFSCGQSNVAGLQGTHKVVVLDTATSQTIIVLHKIYNADPISNHLKEDERYAKEESPRQYLRDDSLEQLIIVDGGGGCGMRCSNWRLSAA
jgi:hypothetical protein